MYSDLLKLSVSLAELNAQVPLQKQQNHALISDSLSFMSYVAERRDVYPITFYINYLEAITRPDETLRAALFSAVILALLPMLKDELRHSWVFEDVFQKGCPPSPIPFNIDIPKLVRQICEHGLDRVLSDGGPKARHLKPNLRLAFEPLFSTAEGVDESITECYARSHVELQIPAPVTQDENWSRNTMDGLQDLIQRFG